MNVIVILTHPNLVILLVLISGYISYKLKNKHVTLECSMLLTLQLYFNSFFYKSGHNTSNPNIDFNFGIQPVTSMRDERGYFPQGCTPQETTPTTPPKHNRVYNSTSVSIW